jgi:hypothetical protein
VRNLPQYPVPFRRAVWGTALAVATFASAPPALGGQGLDPTMPLPPGTTREKGADVSDAAGGRFVQVYRSVAPIEMLLGWYQRRMTPVPDGVLDTVDLQPGEGTQVSSHVTEHSFVDECADSGASARPDSATPPVCKKWRRGLDKKRALQNSRLGLREGTWIERFTMTWFNREANGELVRRRIEVRDAGLSSNWQHDQLRSQITLERVVSRAAP